MDVITQYNKPKQHFLQASTEEVDISKDVFRYAVEVQKEECIFTFIATIDAYRSSLESAPNIDVLTGMFSRMINCDAEKVSNYVSKLKESAFTKK